MNKREKELRARLSALEAEIAKNDKKKNKSEEERKYREAIDALECKDIEIGNCFYNANCLWGNIITYVRIIGIDTAANEAKKKDVQSEYIKHKHKFPDWVDSKPRVIGEYITDILPFKINGKDVPVKTTFVREDCFDYKYLCSGYTKITPEEYEAKRQEILNKNIEKFFND